MKFLKIIFCVLIVSCSGETEKKKPISMEDFVGEFGEEHVEEVVDTLPAVPLDLFNQLVFNQLGEFDTVSFNGFHPIDRFTFNKRKKIGLKSKTTVPYGDDIDVNPSAELFYYTFSDTLKTNNALYNWLDCFGSDCAMVKLEEDMDALKMPPLFSLVYDTLIVIADYRCEDQSFDWNPFQDSLVKHFGKNYKYRMEVGCGGPLHWK